MAELLIPTDVSSLNTRQKAIIHKDTPDLRVHASKTPKLASQAAVRWFFIVQNFSELFRMRVSRRESIVVSVRVQVGPFR